MIAPVRLAWLALVISSNVGIAGASSAGPTCGAVVTTSVVLDRDLDCTGDGVVVAGDGVIVDCAGHTIRGAAAPGTAGIRITGGRDLVVRNCHVVRFAGAVDAKAAPGLLVTGNQLEGSLSYGVVIRDSPGSHVIRNVSRRQRFHATLTGSSGSTIEDNTFEFGGQPGAVNLDSSPDSVVRGNVWTGAGVIGVSDAGASVVDGNVFRSGPSEVNVLRAQRCRVTRNVFEASDDPRDPGGSIRLLDAGECEVSNNRIERIHAFGFMISCHSDNYGRNHVAHNTLRRGGYGMYLEGLRDDLVEDNLVEDAEVGILVISPPDPATGKFSATGGARLARNSISGATFGMYIVDTGTTIFAENELRDNAVALFEVRIFAPNDVLNVYEGNRVLYSSDYGFVAWGTSPVLRGNLFRENGTGVGSASPDLDPLPTLLGGLRGALAFFPFVGRGNDTLDDGNPASDFVGGPVVGGLQRPNVFRGNADFDVYALDARGSNSATLFSDNRFQGSAAHLRQQWFGIVRVVDSAGAAVAGASVEVFDAQGRRVAGLVSGDDGVAPAGVDAARSQGLSPLEPGGPRPPWPRFTEMLVDGRGRRVAGTPHLVVARKGEASGCALYAWNGRSDPGESGTSIDGRYQTAIVRLGAPCLPWAPLPNDASYSGAERDAN